MEDRIVVSGRAPERSVFAVRPGARGDLTLAKGEEQRTKTHTMIYTHVLNQGGRGVRSPLDQLGPGPRRTG